MSRSVAVREDLYDRVAEIAARDRVSVEEFISSAVATRLASREYIESRARLFNRADFEKALDQIPDAEPGDYDRL